MKRGLSLFISVIMVLTLVPSYVFAEGDYGDFDQREEFISPGESTEGPPREPEEKLCRVTLSGSESISVTLNTEYDGSGKELIPDETGEYALAKGIYSYCIESEGYYKLRKIFIITDEDIAAGSKVITIKPERITGQGYEPYLSIYSWNDEIENSLFSLSGLKGYSQVYTPAFYAGKRGQQFTTVSERNSYVSRMAASSSYMYVYYLDEARRIPVVFFTTSNLSGISDIQEAAKKMASNGKTTVFYQAQMHGNEPASGEGALAVISSLAGSYGHKLASELNMYIIPCMNPDASEQFRRSAAGGRNLNRDSLYLGSSEIIDVHNLYNIIMPEVVIDGHECSRGMNISGEGVIDFLDDIEISAACNLNTDSSINSEVQDMTDYAIEQCSRAGLRAYDYGASVNNTISRVYYGLYGSCSVLVESTGIAIGKDHFERRVFSQYTAVKALLDRVYERADSIKDMVSSARNSIIARGAKFDSSNRFVLKHGISYKNGYTLARPSFNIDGTIADAAKTDTYYKYDTALKSRALPTAYIIPKTASKAAGAVRKLEQNGISYFEIAPGSRLTVRQFSGTASKTVLKDAAAVTFSKGAYVIPMNQAGAKVIAACLEPDVKDTEGYKGSFVQSRLLKISNIYRFTGSNPSVNMDMYITKGKQVITAEIENSSSFKLSDKEFDINASCRYGELSYESDNESVVSVDSSGHAVINGAGRAKIKVTAPAIYNYAKTVKTFNITVRPDTVKISSLTGTAKTATVSWEHDAEAAGYQIRYSLKSNMKNSKVCSVRKSLTKKKLRGLKSNTKYYVQVRSYVKTDDGSKIYSSWSDKKNIKTKKVKTEKKKS